jgi:agmatine deiminase
VSRSEEDGASLRMPAEWEPHEAVWLTWPRSQAHDPHYDLKHATTWLTMVLAMTSHVRVAIAVDDERARDHLAYLLRYHGIGDDNVDLHVIPNDDLWMRDNGPIFALAADGRLVVTDWNFNGWGARFPHARDASVPAIIAERLDLPRVTAALVAEGGAIEVNGAGTLMATRSSIQNDNRNPGLSQEEVEAELSRLLGVRHFVWLSGAPPEVCEALGDTTDYHVDIAARFVDEATVLATATDDEGDPRHRWLSRHERELAEATNQSGRRLDVVRLPAPRIHAVSSEAPGHFTDAAYSNYLVTNGVVLVPVFGAAEDERAKAIIAEHFPDREVVGIPCLTLTEDGGAVHCVTQQQPASG